MLNGLKLGRVEHPSIPGLAAHVLKNRTSGSIRFLLLQQDYVLGFSMPRCRTNPSNDHEEVN